MVDALAYVGLARSVCSGWAVSQLPAGVLGWVAGDADPWLEITMAASAVNSVKW